MGGCRCNGGRVVCGGGANNAMQRPEGGAAFAAGMAGRDAGCIQTGRLLGLKDRICGMEEIYHEGGDWRRFSIPSCSRRSAARLCAPSWLTFLFPVLWLIR
jgi:hypothetical protein